MVTGRATGFIAVALLCFLVALQACGGGASNPSPTPSATPAATPSATVSPTPTPSPTVDPFSLSPPSRDLIDLARRFRGLTGEPPFPLRSSPFDYQTGHSEEFFVFDLASDPEVRTVTASLRHTSTHAYFFVEEGVDVSQSTLDRIGRDFDETVYPAVTSAFGPVPSPGVDSDPRVTLLHANLSGVGGYFTSSDAYPREIVPYSNEREMLYLHASILASPGAPYNALAAHELQHMVHANADPGENAWVNEGLSQVAAQMVGGGREWLPLFLDDPDTGLLEWPEVGASAVHYAASELFFAYLLDHYGGRDRARDLVAIKASGIDGVNTYLEQFDTTFAEVFADWLAASYLDEPSGPYSHPAVDTTVSQVTPLGPGAGEAGVAQFGADYLEIGAGAEFRFDGADDISIGVPETDGAFYWSGRGDDIDSHMTRALDLSRATNATLEFDLWFEIERGWDYAYVAASTDGGETWQALQGQHTTDYDPAGQAYGPGYTGESGGWLQEQIDLSDYAGQEVLIRFEYVTDQSTHGTGLAIDNIAVETVAYEDGGDGHGWDAQGFRRVTGPLAQEWIVQIIEVDTAEVSRLRLDARNEGAVQVLSRSVVIVSAVTAGTTERAPYHWEVLAG